MTTNPPRHPDLFAPILCEHCAAVAEYLINADRPRHVCGDHLDVTAERHDWGQP